jgi:hypothetical protein
MISNDCQESRHSKCYFSDNKCGCICHSMRDTGELEEEKTTDEDIDIVKTDNDIF